MSPKDGKIRALFLEVTASMGGVEVTTLQTISLLDQTHFEALLCCPEEGNLTTLCREIGGEVHIVPLPRFSSVSIQLRDRAIVNPFAILWDGLLCLYATIKLARFFRQCEADLICTKGLLAHLYGGVAAKLVNLPCVWHVQEVVEAKRALGLFLKLLRWMATIFASQIIGDAETVTAQFSNIPKLSSRIQTIYNGVDAEVFTPRQATQAIREQLGIPKNAFVIGCVARLMFGKGQHILLPAFHSIAERYPNMLLVLVGKGLFDGGAYENQLRQMVTQLGLETRIRFTGFVAESSLAFNTFDTAVHASVEPDSPLSVMEAMASGCPLVLTAVPGCQELVREGEALLIPPCDSDALAQAIVQLYEDKALREKLSCAARAAAVERFSLSSSVRRIEAVFKNSLPKGTAHP